MPSYVEDFDLAEGRIIEDELRALVEHAKRRGFVLEVHLVPLVPLAMGNFRMEASVRPARGQS